MKIDDEHDTFNDYAQEYTRTLILELHALVPIIIDPKHLYYEQAKELFIEIGEEFLSSTHIKLSLCPLLYEIYVTAISRCLLYFKITPQYTTKPH